MEVCKIQFGFTFIRYYLFFMRVTDQTPLHIAASVSKCRSSAMTLLFHPDIDPDLLNNCNEKAAEIAKRSGRAFPIFQMADTAFQNDIGLID